MTVQILFPFSDKTAAKVVIAADAFGVEPWEMAAHALWFRASVMGVVAAGGVTEPERSEQ